MTDTASPSLDASLSSALTETAAQLGVAQAEEQAAAQRLAEASLRTGK
jgi:hypothetical protein